MVDEDKITIEVKITVPVPGRNIGKTLEHVLNAAEEIARAGRSVISKPEVKAKVKKVEVK